MKKLRYILLFACIVNMRYGCLVKAEDAKPQFHLDIEVKNGEFIIKEAIDNYIFDAHNLYVLQRDKVRIKGKHQLSRISRTRLIGLTPSEKVTIDYVAQGNPFFTDPVDYVTSSGDLLFATRQAAPATLYMFTVANDETNIHMISARDIHDAQGNVSAGIVGLAYGHVPEGSVNMGYIFAAVKKHDGCFGQEGSGIALIRHDPDVKEQKKDTKDKNKEKENKEKPEKKKKEGDKKEEEEKSKPFLDIVDSSLGKLRGNKAYPLDFVPTGSDLISINDGLKEIAPNIVDLHWDSELQRCYVALNVTTKDVANNDQGACALLVGRIKDKQLHFVPAAPHAALCGNNHIIGATGCLQKVSLHRVKTMHINGAKYLVVVGGNGDKEATASCVYAFPVVATHNLLKSEETREEYLFGTIASQDCIPEKIPNAQNVCMARIFKHPCKNDFYTNDDIAVRVGGFAELPGPIDDITMHNNVIIVSVGTDGHGKSAGAFYSQAIINEDGKVAAWTAWQRVIGGNKKVLGVQPGVGEFRFLYKEEKDDFLHVRTTAWHTADTFNAVFGDAKTFSPLSFVISQLSHLKDVRAIADYAYSTPGISGTHEQMSMLAATGKQSVYLFQTAESNNGILKARYNASDNGVYIAKDGSLSQFADISDMQPTRALYMTGGALEKCGLITCSSVGSSKNNAWFFVGGTGGLAVLAQQDGCGWDSATGLRNGFNALQNKNFAFKYIGNYKFIRKLVCCGDYLYVLTNTSLDRILLAPHQFAQEIIAESVIAPKTVAGRKIYYNDVAISPELLLLAASDGLYYKNMKHTSSGLVYVSLPQLAKEQQSVANLFVISPTERSLDFAHSGQVYVTVRANHWETYIYRLFVDISRGIDNAVKLVFDCYKNDQPSYFIRYHTPQQGFVTDGIFTFNYCSRTTEYAPHVSLNTLADFRSVHILKKGLHNVELPLQFDQADNIWAVARNSAEGAWFIATDSGLRINV